MSRFLCALLALFVTGCSSIALPHYIPDKNPYKRRFDSRYVPVVDAARFVLKEMGWAIKEETDPGIYERSWRMDDQSVKHVLIFTDYERSNYFVHSKNTVINAYVRENTSGSTDVELRYLNISTIPYKNFYEYRNDKLINKIYKRIEEKLIESEK